MKWQLKKNYIDDFEILKIKKNKIIELGNKTINLKEIDARYVGITKFFKKIHQKIKKRKNN